jgi:Chaperone of endosialidase
MNRQNQLRRTSPPLLIASALVLSCLVLSPAVQAAPNSNTSYGRGALPGNTMGDFNSAFGVNALGMNSTGSFNTAVGNAALESNTNGTNNTAIGQRALSNSTGFDNSALGQGAGALVSTASNVICIGANVAGANVSSTTWIGHVFGVTPQNGTTAPVVVSDAGQLGTVASSERFKKDISTMEKASEAILSLRPVTFHYKSDSKGTPQFGLVAEEVAKVNPGLVLPDKEGRPYTVRYDAVNAMLLNEFLKEHRTVQELKSVVAKQEAAAARQQKQIEALTVGLQKVSAQLEESKPAPQVVNNP